MRKNEFAKSGQAALLPITILCQYEDLGEQLEERRSGFLTGFNHAMFVEPQYDTLMIVKVKPTNDPFVYLTVSPTMELGRVDDASKHAETVEAVAEGLKNMTALEFVTKIMMNVKQEVHFDGMIVPAPVNLESGVS